MDGDWVALLLNLLWRAPSGRRVAAGHFGCASPQHRCGGGGDFLGCAKIFFCRSPRFNLGGIPIIRAGKPARALLRDVRLGVDY
jgi:hypothetical protein